MNTLPIIPIDTPSKKFDQSVTQDSNIRIFFSGKFGIGKTYFLEKYFRDKDEYEVFHLFPVRYQLAETQDIFNLIKFDLIVELLKKDPESFDDGHIELIIAGIKNIYPWMKQDPTVTAIAKTGVEVVTDYFIPLLGRPLTAVCGAIDRFQKYKDDNPVAKGEIIQKFYNEIKNLGVENETDIISALIHKTLDDRTNKKKVLILDDLDRMDPEHIFRILNVFANEFGSEQNKFGFDKVILVADYENIRSIFHHKYGDNTDFEGYMSKFSSIGPFVFDNNAAIFESIAEILRNIPNQNDDLEKTLGNGGTIHRILVDFMTGAIRLKQASTIDLIKLSQHQFITLCKGAYFYDQFIDRQTAILLDIFIKLLIEIFSDKDNLLAVIKKMKDDLNSDSERFTTYKYLNYTMFAEMKIPVSNDGLTDWKGYKIKIVGENPRVELESETADNNMSLYYDLLTEYIQTGTYAKRNWYEYESEL